jgi:hypothetical protein
MGERGWRSRRPLLTPLAGLIDILRGNPTAAPWATNLSPLPGLKLAAVLVSIHAFNAWRSSRTSS